MDNPFLAVDSDDSSFTTFVGSSGDDDFIVFADWNGANLELVAVQNLKKCSAAD